MSRINASLPARPIAAPTSVSAATLTAIKNTIAGNFADAFSSRASVDGSSLKGGAAKLYAQYAKSAQGVDPEAFTSTLNGQDVTVVMWSGDGVKGKLGLFDPSGKALATGRWGSSSFRWDK